MDDISMRTISEECEDTYEINKSPDSEFKVEKLQRENEMLKNQLLSANTKKEQLKQDLEEATNEMIVIQKQAFSETQERMTNFQDEYFLKEKEILDKLKFTESENIELTRERDELKTQLLQSNDKTEECNLKIAALSQQISELKTYINEIVDKSSQLEDDLITKDLNIEELKNRLSEQEKAIVSGSEEIVMSLKQDINELQGRLKKKTISYDNLVLENHKSAEIAAAELQKLQQKINGDAQNHRKVYQELSELKARFEDLSYKYYELLMSSNIQETEMEKMDELKTENKRLKSRLSVGHNLKMIEEESFEPNDLNISDDNNGNMEDNAIISLNKTLQSKCQELEHITFLYDEREVEIKEARESLEEHNHACKAWEELVSKQEDEMEKLLSELEFTKLEIAEVKNAKNTNKENENEIKELKEIINEQEQKMREMGSLELIKRELEDTKLFNGDLLKQKTDLENMIILNKEKFQEEKNALLSSLKEMTIELSDAKSISSELENFKAKEDEFKKEKEVLKISLEQIKKELDEVKAINNQLINFKEQLENAILVKEEEYRKKTDAFLDEKEAYESKLESLNDEVLDLIKEKENRSVHVFETEKEDAPNEGDKYIQELELEIEILQKDLSEAQSGLLESEQQINMLKEIIKQQEDEIIKLGEKAKLGPQPKEQATDYEGTLNEMANSHRLLKGKLSEAEIANEEAERQNVQLQNIVVEKEKEFEQEKENLLNEREQLEKMVESLNDEVLRLHNEQSSLRQTEDIAAVRPAERTEQMENKIEILQKELLQSKETNQSSDSRIVELKELIKEQETEMAKLHSKLETATQRRNMFYNEAGRQEMAASLADYQDLLQKEQSSKEQILSQNTELHNLINSREEELLKMQEIVTSLPNMEQELTEVKRANEELLGQNSYLQDVVSATKDALSEEQTQHELNCELLEKEEAKISELRNIIKEQEVEIVRLGEKLEVEKNNINDDKADEFADAHEQLKNQLQDVIASKDIISQQKAELENCINIKEEQYRREKDAFLDEKEEYECKVESLNDEILKLHEEMELYITQKEEKLKQKDEEIVSDDTTEKINDLRCEIECLQKELSDSEKAESAQELRVTELTKIIKDQETEIIRLSEKLKLAESLHISDESKSSLEKVSNELQTAENEKGELLAKCNSLEAEILAKDKEIKTIKENLQNNRIKDIPEVESVKKMNEELSSKLQHSDILIGNLRRVIYDQEEEINNADKERESLKEQFAKGKSMYEKMLKALENERKANTALQEAMNEAGEEIESLRSRLENEEMNQEMLSSKDREQKENSESLQKEIESLRKSLELHEKQSEEHILAKQAELEDILEQHMKLEEQNKKRQEQLQNQREQMKEWSEAVTLSQVEISNLKERLNRDERPNQQETEGLQEQINELNRALAERNALNAQLQQRVDSQNACRNELEKTLTLSQNQNINLKNALERVQEQLKNSEVDLDEHKVKLETAQENIKAVESELAQVQDQQQTDLLDEFTRLEKIIAEQQEKLNEKQCGIDENSKAKIKELENAVENSQTTINDLRESLKSKSSLLEEQSKKVEESEKSKAQVTENMRKQVNRLRKIIDEQQDEIDEAVQMNEQLQKDAKKDQDVGSSVIKMKQLEKVIEELKTTVSNLTESLQIKNSLLEELNKKLLEAEKERNRVEENKSKQVNRLRKIIDEQQEEIDEAVRNNEQLQKGLKSNEHLEGLLPKSTIDEAEQKFKMKEENMVRHFKRLRTTIEEQQEEIDEANRKNVELEEKAKLCENKLKDLTTEVENLKVLKNMDQIKALRTELAQKNMKIQELHYKSLKSEEEMDRLRREVQFGYSKMSKLKQDLRKAQDEAVKDDTIPVKRFKSSAAEDENAGVVSSVAVYSLRAKLEQLEKEKQVLKENNNQLEKDKVTMSIYKTDVSNQASKLSDEVHFLRKQVKELTKQNRLLKGKEEKATSQNVLAPSNPPSGHNLNGSIEPNPEPSIADKRKAFLAQESENRHTYSGWMSPSNTKDFFKDKANQCPHQ